MGGPKRSRVCVIVGAMAREGGGGDSEGVMDLGQGWVVAIRLQGRTATLGRVEI